MRLRAKLLRLGAVILGAFAVIWITTFARISYVDRPWAHQPPQLAPADVIVVLGGGMSSRWRLAASSQPRLDMGITLFQNGYAPLLFLTGGGTQTGQKEADRLAELARAQGIADNVIATETRSTSTLQNAKFTADALGADPKIILVTERFHMIRAKRDFARFGFSKIQSLAVYVPAPTKGKAVLRRAREASKAVLNPIRYRLWRLAKKGYDPKETPDWIIG